MLKKLLTLGWPLTSVAQAPPPSAAETAAQSGASQLRQDTDNHAPHALHEIAGVSAAAVVGVPDELLGQAVRAYVVLEHGARLTEQEIVRASRAKLEGFMVPKEVRFVAELPQTESGKVRKQSLLMDSRGDQHA